MATRRTPGVPGYGADLPTCRGTSAVAIAEEPFSFDCPRLRRVARMPEWRQSGGRQASEVEFRAAP